MEEQKSKKIPDLCEKCEYNHAAKPHTCPYAEEIKGDITKCTCCANCEYECNMDI